MFGMHLAGALGRAVIPDLTVPTGDPDVNGALPLFAAGFLAVPMAAIKADN